jgi:diphthamide biosynthesis protein 3
VQGLNEILLMTFYDEVEIEDFDFDPLSRTFYYPCPCGDRFQITLDEINEGEEIARCPSCSLMLRVIGNFDKITLPFISAEQRNYIEV